MNKKLKEVQQYIQDNPNYNFDMYRWDRCIVGTSVLIHDDVKFSSSSQVLIEGKEIPAEEYAEKYLDLEFDGVHLDNQPELLLDLYDSELFLLYIDQVWCHYKVRGSV